MPPLFERVASLRALYEPLVVQDYERTLGITEADKAKSERERAAAEAIAIRYDNKTPSKREVMLLSLSASEPTLLPREGGHHSHASKDPNLASSPSRAHGMSSDAQRQRGSTSSTLLRRGANSNSPSTSASTTVIETLPLDATTLPEALFNAGHTFNMRHTSRTRGARNLLNALQMPAATLRPPPTMAKHRFGNAVGEVHRNRLWVPESYDPFTAPATRKKYRRARKYWHLDVSIWYPRKLSGNSRDYYETEGAMGDLFETDWAFIVGAHGLGKLIIHLDTGERSQGLSAEQVEVHKAVLAAKEALWNHHDLLYNAFLYYSLVFDTKRDEQGEFDLDNMVFNSYMEFARDNVVVHGDLPISVAEVAWSTANVADKRMAHLDRYNKRNSLSRHEFLQCIVRLAIESYSKTGKATHVGEAISRLCKLMATSCPAEVNQHGNEFRRKRCYTEDVDASLRRHETSLRSIFEVYSALNTDIHDRLQTRRMMSAGEFYTFVEHVGLFQMGQLSSFAAKLIFKWSIIRTAVDHEEGSLIKLRNMHFEDFLEALVRIACVIAQPTDTELAESGAEDAGEFLLVLRASSESEYARFVERRRVEWNNEPKQLPSRCMTHLMALLLRIISRTGHGRLEKKSLSTNDVGVFEFGRRNGKAVVRSAAQPALCNSVREAASIVRARLILSLRNVDIFRHLDIEQLTKLADQMAEAHFEEGNWVFDQGDEGDSFYVIIHGSVTAVRVDTDQTTGDQVEKELATLTDGQFFGERSLLKNQTRYAGMRVDSKVLSAVYITRARFEAAMGTTLEMLVPDQYKLDRSELLSRLRHVAIFEELSMKQLTALADRMSEEHLENGRYVFYEGDDGDAFYVVIKGTAAVLKYSNGSDQQIGQLKQWSSFGERALVRDECRFAGIRATSELWLLRIRRSDFEEVLGGPLKNFIREQRYAELAPAKALKPPNLKQQQRRKSSRFASQKISVADLPRSPPTLQRSATAAHLAALLAAEPKQRRDESVEEN